MGTVMLAAEAVADGAGAAQIRSHGLTAEYSVGQTVAGRWFAIGSVRCLSTSLNHPAWVIVGTGTTADDAIAALQVQLDGEARHLVANS
jgi:hypothetical protein